jgi:hypothetical protein
VCPRADLDVGGKISLPPGFVGFKIFLGILVCLFCSVLRSHSDSNTEDLSRLYSIYLVCSQPKYPALF